MQLTIPGSEIFNSRPLPMDELRSRIHPKLRLHSVAPGAGDALDPLTYEVVRHRLWSITDEMGETLKRMSGSLAVAEGNDFDFTICDELGQEVQVGLYNTGLAASMDLAIYWTLQHRSENPGIEEGDMFLCNDPWVGGGLHQNDASLIAPIFWDGQLFGWSTAICHQIDVGGVAPGSWTPRAVDVFWESLPTPPVKVVRGYELQRDVADLWMRRSRTPLLLGLDLRAKLGANLIARDRFRRLLDRYGPDVVKATMQRMMNDAERRLRAKLAALPDGTWRSVGYQEQAGQGDRGAYRLVVELTKTDDHMVFDFRGTAPQTGMINCPYSGMRAGVMFSLLPILAGDIPWAAGGLMRCFDLVSDEGTMNNASFPAAIGKAPVGPAWATANLVAECFAKMLDTTPQSRPQVQSICSGTFDLCVLAGLDQRGAPTVALIMDTVAGGYGAQVDQDGVDTAGFLVIPMGRAPDVEMSEFLHPFLYLWRREEIDSAGAGRQRGGVSASVCVIPHDTAAPLGGVFSGSGKAVPMSLGLAGGYPGSTQLDVIYRGAQVRELLATGRIPTSVDELGGAPDVIGAEAETLVMPDDAMFLHWQAGGGYGDPLRRDAAAVAGDVRSELVSPAAARDLYGVVLDGAGGVDEAATTAQRAELRRHRRERCAATEHMAEPELGTEGEELDDNLVVVAGGDGPVVACRHCGHRLGPWGGNYLDGLARYDGDPAEGGPRISADPAQFLDTEVVFRQFCCPGCWTAVLTQVVPVDHPVVLDRQPTAAHR
jgi:N-methylhydantoinase B